MDAATTFNVIEVDDPSHPSAGFIAVVPTKPSGSRLKLRRARYRLYNTSYDRAAGFVAGVVSERLGGD